MKPSDSVHSEMQPVQAGITVRTACVHESATREGLTSPPDLHNRRTSADVFLTTTSSRAVFGAPAGVLESLPPGLSGMRAVRAGLELVSHPCRFALQTGAAHSHKTQSWYPPTAAAHERSGGDAEPALHELMADMRWHEARAQSHA